MTASKQKQLTPQEFEAKAKRLTKRAQRLASEINQLNKSEGSVLEIYNALGTVSHEFTMRAVYEREARIQQTLKRHAEDVRTGKVTEGPSTTLPEDLMYSERMLREDEGRRAFSNPIRISR